MKLCFTHATLADQRSDGLLDKFRKDPNSLNQYEREQFITYLERYYVETMTGRTSTGYKWVHQ
ncbi:hypothetical protein BKK52_04185 [Rodentibacter trehalosifermentans]|uniref:Uncharacterized protein n=1 Tax=Rodentibacter trehalosifermentans TaxID=1908263 RepID=A0A1V3J2R1_9PAST|nr:hypothetical protein BKK52_04185 [Rodentibacter trehalosifermentans]